MFYDLQSVKIRIISDPTLSPERKQQLLSEADHAWTSNPGGISTNELVAMGFGALAGYLFGGLTGASPVGRLANAAIGAGVAAWMTPNRPEIYVHNGYYTYR